MRMKISPLVCFAACALALAACGPPDPALLPSAAPRPKPQPAMSQPIGTATMRQDGTLVMRLQADTDSGAAQMTMRLAPIDPDYAKYVKQLGGLKPGQSKPIPASAAN